MNQKITRTSDPAQSASQLLQVPENSKLSYVELRVAAEKGKMVVGKAMLCLSTGIVFDAVAVDNGLPGEIALATEIRQPSSGHVAAVRFFE
ncbi:hypothetical protein, partial [Paraburkholderia sp. SIMBA_053]